MKSIIFLNLPIPTFLLSNPAILNLASYLDLFRSLIAHLVLKVVYCSLSLDPGIFEFTDLCDSGTLPLSIIIYLLLTAQILHFPVYHFIIIHIKSPLKNNFFLIITNFYKYCSIPPLQNDSMYFWPMPDRMQRGQYLRKCYLYSGQIYSA